MSTISRYEANLKSLARQQLSSTVFAVTELMSRAKLPWSLGKKKFVVTPEQQLSVEFADELRKLVTNGRLKAVWCHVSNEGQRGALTALLLKAMGLIPGSPDYWFIWQNKGCLIELKRPDQPLPKALKDNQAHFQLWAESENVPFYVHNTISGAMESLRREGLLV